MGKKGFERRLVRSMGQQPLEYEGIDLEQVVLVPGTLSILFFVTHFVVLDKSIHFMCIYAYGNIQTVYPDNTA